MKFNKKNIAGIMARLILTDKKLDIINGDKVYINVKRIKGYKDYNKRQEKYKEWLEENKDKIFTAKLYDEQKTIYELEEDKTWHFWGGDLIKVRD